MIPVEHYLAVAALLLFVIGIFGIFLNRKNVIVILMSIELMLLAVNINFVAFSTHLGDLTGQVFTLFVSDRRRRRGRDWVGYSGLLLPCAWHDCGRRY